MNGQKIVRGRWVLADAETAIEDGAVLIEGETVAAVGPWAELRARAPEAEVFGSADAAVIPGLVNAHHHSNGATAIQHAIPDLLLESWILMHALKRESDPYLDTLLSAGRLLRTGVTNVVELHSGRDEPAAYAETLMMRLVESMTGPEIARATGMSPGSVRVNLHRGMKLLHKRLGWDKSEGDS